MSDPSPASVPGKPAVTSVSIWGSLVALLSIAAPLILPHLGLTPDDASNAVNNLSAIGAAVGSLLAIYGRVRASQPITSIH